MESVEFERPGTVEEAVNLLQSTTGNAKILAGGTDLLVQLRAHMVEPDVIIDIKDIEETRTLTKNSDGSYTIGAAVAGAEAGDRDDITKDWPGVVEGWELIGSTQIQGRASLGGNLCNASPAGDSVPAMVAAGMTVNIAGPNGRRTIPVEEVTVGPGRTCLEKGEFVVSFNLPARPARGGDAYLRLIPRTEMDIAVVSAACFITLDKNEIIKDLKISLGAVAPTVIDISGLDTIVKNSVLEDELLSKISTICSKSCDPIDDKRGTIEFLSLIHI